MKMGVMMPKMVVTMWAGEGECMIPIVLIETIEAVDANRPDN